MSAPIGPVLQWGSNVLRSTADRQKRAGAAEVWSTPEVEDQASSCHEAETLRAGGNQEAPTEMP